MNYYSFVNSQGKNFILSTITSRNLSMIVIDASECLDKIDVDVNIFIGEQMHDDFSFELGIPYL